MNRWWPDQGLGEAGRGEGAADDTGSALGVMKTFGIRWWLYNISKALNATVSTFMLYEAHLNFFKRTMGKAHELKSVWPRS